MNSSTEKFLKLIRLLAWLAFLGFLVKAGGIIMSFGVSFNNAEAAKDMYRGMDLSRYETYSFIHFAAITLYHIISNLMLAYIALFTAKILKSEHIENPRSNEMIVLLRKISFTILGVAIIGTIHNIHVGALERNMSIIADYFPNEYIFLSILIYVLAQLFIKSITTKMTSE